MTNGMRLAASAAFVAAAVWAAQAGAVDADPSNYTSVVPTLKPGDTLYLAPGTYASGLDIAGLNGSENAPIIITGPDAGDPVIIQPKPSLCCNNVELTSSSHVVLRNVTIDSNGLDGIFGISAKGGTSNLVHHITIEGCTITGAGASQQTVGISTKTPTWGWVIRRNRILGAGTGMYLGNSDGSSPFVAGLIENNLIQDPIGYCMQIKYQLPRPEVAGMPTGDSTTIVRHNVFIKGDQPSPDGDRPNVLLGGFPESGAGANDLYQVYGNLFFHNPRESLMQASGRVSIHDNIFVDASDKALVLQNHDLPLKLAHVYSNTIYAAKTGIAFGSLPSQEHRVTGNLIFADTAISGAPPNASDNLSDSIANAAAYVVSPSMVLGTMDLYPLAGKCEGTALDLSAFATQADYDRDFNAASKGGFAFRGAYAGAGTNPGWKLGASLKELGAGGAAGAGGSGGSSMGGAGGQPAGGQAGKGGTAPAAGGTSGSAGASASTAADDDSGCGCGVVGRSWPASAWLLIAMAALGARLRRS